MSTALRFHQLLGNVLVRQVEYSYSEAEDSFTTMIPMNQALLPRVVELAKTIPFAGQWAWSIQRFAAAIQPDEFLFRLDWLHSEATTVTLYCRFPSEPSAPEFQKAIGFARGFKWDGPDPSAIGISLGVNGPRGIAFRATKKGNLRTSIYFRSEEHVGANWTERLTTLLAACRYPQELAVSIEGHLKQLYRPGPVGVIGIDEGPSGVPTTIKFDPSEVPISIVFGFLTRVGVSTTRINALRRIAIGLRAQSVTYAGVQYGLGGLSGFRLYFACEPTYARNPGQVAMASRRTLRSAHRLPHY